ACCRRRSSSSSRDKPHGRSVVSRRRAAQTRSLCAAIAAAAALVAATMPQQAATRPARVACGVELWSLKTLSDPQRFAVNLHPRNTTITAINALRMPHPTPRTRNTLYERRAWRGQAQIVQFKLEGESDTHPCPYWAGRSINA